MRHVEILRQLPLLGLHHILVAHHGPGLGQVVQGVQGAPVAAFQQLLRFLTLAQRGQRAARCSRVQYVLGIRLLHCPGKDCGLLWANLLRDGGHLPEQVVAARSQRLRPEHLPLCGGGDPARFDNAAHHVPEDAVAKLVPRGGQQPGVGVDLLRGQQGVTSWCPSCIFT